MKRHETALLCEELSHKNFRKEWKGKLSLVLLGPKGEAILLDYAKGVFLAHTQVIYGKSPLQVLFMEENLQERIEQWLDRCGYDPFSAVMLASSLTEELQRLETRFHMVSKLQQKKAKRDRLNELRKMGYSQREARTKLANENRFRRNF